MPGWPLPAFSTASMASTRTVSTARWSRSVHSSFWRAHRSSGSFDVDNGRSRQTRTLSTVRAYRARPSSRRFRRTDTVGAARRARTAPERDRRSDQPATERGARRDGRRLSVRVSAPCRPSCTADGRPGGRAPATALSVPGYVALTKPRIIELLLVTTVPDDVPGRGRRAVAVAGRGHPGRRHAGRGQRQRAQLLPRPRHRPGDAPHRAAAAGHRAGRARARRWSSASCSASSSVAWLAVTTGWLRRRARRRRDRVLRRRLHDGAQAAHPAEHRLGRRCRLHAGADRLGGRDRLAGLGAGRAVRGRLLLDAAALLAAGDALPRRLRRGRRADAAGGRRRRRGGAGRSSPTAG